MSDNNFYTPTDTDALRRENELLAFEVRFLKSRASEVERLEEAERTAAWLGRRLDNSERQLEMAKKSEKQLMKRLAEAERAEQDLILLLRRLTKSPLARGLKLWSNFRVLEQRYLDKNG